MDPSVKQHLPYIDCLRGYAILLVITCHLAYIFPELPYPVHRIVVAGWFGVQLFFLASCLTLLQSWHSELRRTGTVSVSAFFIRRFFRIAPAYYLAAALYCVVDPLRIDYSFGNIIRSLIFINGLLPVWVTESHSIVPGGWSIGVEFSFYAIFPIFAYLVTSLRRAIITFFGAVIFGLISNLIAVALLSSNMSPDALSKALFFWFPNQLSVFSLGGIVYFLINDYGTSCRQFLLGRGTFAIFTAALLFCSSAFVPLGRFIGDVPLVPASLAVSMVFMIVILALSNGPSILVNRAVATMGKVSFSAYLIHFAILDMEKSFPDIMHTHEKGYQAILGFAVSWPMTVLLTFILAWLSFKFIEGPGIGLGRLINQSRSKAKSYLAAPS